MNGKYFIILILIFISGVSNAQQNVKQLFNEFSGAEKVSKTSLSKPGCKPASALVDVKGIKSAEMLNLEECGEDIKTRFADAVKQLKDTDYETLMKMEQDGLYVRLLVKMRKNVIKEVVMLSAGSECAIIWIKGKIDLSALNVIQKEIQ